MRLSILIVLALSFVEVRATDLTCFAWDPFVTFIGLICHFKPKLYQAAANATVQGVEDTAKSVKNLVSFSLTHNPITLTYDYTKTLASNGSSSANQQLGASLKDWEHVTIGLGEGLWNQNIQIWELTHWNDVAWCLMSGAVKLSAPLAAKRRRALPLPAVGSAMDMASACYKNHWSKTLQFNMTTNPNEKLGATIADLAALLVPVGAEEKAASAAASGAMDLAIPGAEDSTRIYKKVAGNNVAQHFADDKEAKLVSTKLQDAKFEADSCFLCEAPLIAGAAVVRRSDGRIAGESEVDRRGTAVSKAFAACCSVPAHGVLPPTTEIEAPSLHSFADATGLTNDLDPLEPDIAPIVYGNPKYLEADLVPPPAFGVYDTNVAGSSALVQAEMSELSTSVVKWSPEMIEAFPSDKIFAAFRSVFEGPRDGALYKALKIHDRDGALRTMSWSRDWVDSADSILKPYQDFARAAFQHAIDVTAKLKGIAPAVAKENYRGGIEFFYTAPSESARLGTDKRAFHLDGGMISYGLADTPGLIIENTAKQTASRMPVTPNTLAVIKNAYWDVPGMLKDERLAGTLHAVYGPEMAQQGRVSMVIELFDKRKPWTMASA